MATSSRVLARGSAVMPRAAASSEIVRGQRRVAVGEAAGVVAGEAHVQPPVAELEVGVVVGRLGRVGDLADEGDRVEKDGATNQVSIPCRRMRQSGRS